MALSLMFRLGERVYIDDRYFTVSGQPSSRECVIDTDDGQRWLLQDDRMTEVFTDVMVGVDERAQGGMVWLLFNAPKHIVILREKRYKKQEEDRCSA